MKLTSQASKLATVFAPVLLAYHTAEMKLESGFKTFLHNEFLKYWNTLPESKKATNELAVQWKNDAKVAADSLGYQGQWVGKCLMAVEPVLMRQRAERSNKGTKSAKHPAFRQPQLDYIKEVAKGLNLTSVQIEKLLIALS